MRKNRLLILDRHTYWVAGEKNIELRKRSDVLVAIAVDQDRFSLFKSFFPPEPTDEIPVVVVPSDEIARFAAEFDPSKVCWIISSKEEYSHAFHQNHLVICPHPCHCRQGDISKELLDRFDARYLASTPAARRKLVVALDIDETLCYFIASKNAGFLIWNHYTLEKVKVFLEKYRADYDIELIVLTARLSNDELFEKNGYPYLATKNVCSQLRELLCIHEDIKDPALHHLHPDTRALPGIKKEVLRERYSTSAIVVLFDDNSMVWGTSSHNPDHHFMKVDTTYLDDKYRLFQLDHLALLTDFLDSENGVSATRVIDPLACRDAFFAHNAARNIARRAAQNAVKAEPQKKLKKTQRCTMV